jgi:cyclophilin family peptidyl-prolyl cis-trans isomerase
MLVRTLFAALAAVVAAGTARAANPVVVLETSKGDIKIELFEDKAPVTVKNFLTYVDEKHYDGLVFHRVMKDFMIQGGGYDADLKERKTHAPIKNESGNGVPNSRGYIAMARTEDLDSATSQFYINTVDNPGLDKAKYCAFGRVIDGMDVVDKIRNVATTAKGIHQNLPTDTIVIKKATRAEKK